MLVCRVNTRKHRLIDLGRLIEEKITELAGPLHKDDLNNTDCNASSFAFYLLHIIDFASKNKLINGVCVMHDNKLRESDMEEVLIKFSYTPNMKYTDVKVEIVYGSLQN